MLDRHCGVVTQDNGAVVVDLSDAEGVKLSKVINRLNFAKGSSRVNMVMVVVVKEVSGAMPRDLWEEDMPLPGDIIVQLTSRDGIIREPFYGGKMALEDELRQLYRTQDWIRLKVRRLQNIVDMKVYVVAKESCMPKKHFTIRAFSDHRHVVVLDDCTEETYSKLQEATRQNLKTHSGQRIESRTVMFKQRMMELLYDGANNIKSYPWPSKMDESLPAEESSMIFSILFIPFKNDGRNCTDQFRDVEDTSARAMTWFCAAQSSGVPIIFVNIQTELILDTPNRMLHLFNGFDPDSAKRLTDSGRYTIDSWERLKIEIVRGVRLWYAPVEAELPVKLILEEGHTRYGLTINSTDEGFCYILTIENGSACEQAGLKIICEAAANQSKKIVISRVGGRKVTPWMVSSGGSIHCVDSVCIGNALQFARGVGSVLIHVMVCEGAIPKRFDSPSGFSF